MMKSLKAICAAALILATGSALATPFTMLSPTGVNVTATGATKVGGIVIDLYGNNGAHVISEVAASTLYSAYSASDFTIGTQTGYTAAVIAALGGGLKAAAFRFTLFDGDSASGNFDYNQNTLFANNVNFGNWSAVATQQTDNAGNVAQSNGVGFRDNLLDTGWFYSTNTGLMSSLFMSLQSTNKIVFRMHDNTPGDNSLDFTRGVNGTLINVGQAPVVTAAVPEPGSLALLGLGLLGFAVSRRKSRK